MIRHLAAASAPATFAVVIFLMVVGICALITGTLIWVFAKTVARNRADRNAPLLSRPARVVAKRTGVRGSNHSSSSSYYATFEFPDGVRAELSMRGDEYGLLAEGDTGTLASQGTLFRGFQRGPAIQDAPGPYPYPPQA